MIGESLIREALDLQPNDQTKPRKKNPMTYERAVTEQELTEKAVAPRVTDEQVEAFIKSETYFTAADGVRGQVGHAQYADGRDWFAEHPELSLLTFCVLVLANGFTVHGMSACADPSNFDSEIGRRIARANAKAHVWGHLGFELRSKLALVEKASPPTQDFMTTHVGTKVVHARPMTRGDYNVFRGWDLPADEDPNDPGYLVEYADGGEPNITGFRGYVSWSPKDVFDRAYGSPLR